MENDKGVSPKPVRIILDTDMLTDCDDAAALKMLHALADSGEADILATAVSSRYPMSAPVVDAVNTYCGRPWLTVGVPKGGSGAYRDDSCFLDAVAGEFPHRLLSNDDAPDAVKIYRKILGGAKEKEITVVTIGYMTNLANLLKSGPDEYSPLIGRELVARKVTEWVCMGGNFPVDDATENVNFTRDPENAVYAIRNWPGRITFVGREIGHSIFVGDALKGTPVANPVRRAYQLHRERFGASWDHHTADPCTILYAVRGLGDYFEMREGEMDIQPDCSFRWKAGAGKRQGYLLRKMDRERMGKIMEELMTRTPIRKDTGG